MQTFGAEMTGYQRTLPRTKLLRQLKKHRARAAFRPRGGTPGTARHRTPKSPAHWDPREAPRRNPRHETGSLPEGVSVARDRIEVRFNGAKEAVERLYALAHALINDDERFEELVDGGGEVVNE